jgi:hypothetical protein
VCPGERQQAGVVLQEHGSFLGHVEGERLMRVRRHVRRRRWELVVEEAEPEHRVDDPVDHVVEARLRDDTRFHRLLQRLELELRRHLHVEAGIRVRNRVGRKEPVGHDEAVEAELVLQDVLLDVSVAAGVDLVDAVVGTHHRADVTLRDGSLEGRQVDLVHRPVVDVGRLVVAVRLRVVRHEVLDGGDHVLALDSLDPGNGRLPREIRVLP